MEVNLLGPVEVSVDGAVARLGGPRQRAVLAMLGLTPGRVQSVDRLVDGVWGEEPPGQPLSSLQVYVHGLRKAIADVGGDRTVLASRPPGYVLQVPGEATDVGQFEALCAQARSAYAEGRSAEATDLFTRALGLWRGPALGDLRGLPFAEAEVARLDESFVTAQEDCADARLAAGDHATLVADLERLAQEHPTRERLWGQLMVALYRSDRQVDALETYGRARDRLADELGIDPGEALRALELAILRHDPDLRAPVGDVVVTDTTRDDRRDRPAPRGQTRLPRHTTTLVGRDDLLEQVTQTLSSPRTHLVSLVGPGGSGKTRLAVAAAERLAGDFAAGAHFVDGSDAADGLELLTTVSLAFGAGGGHDSLAEAAEAIAEGNGAGRVLIVLDNLEVVQGAGEAVAALLDADPDSVVLVTTRIPMRLAQETAVLVPPLPVPEAGSAGSAGLEQVPAVALVVDRIRAVRPGFELAGDDAVAVVDLCRLLDGVPLALELAASRMRMLRPSDVVARLQGSLNMLAANAIDAPAAQRTLVGTIEWSLDHLAPSVRDLLGYLVMFDGGFGIDAVETIAALTSPDSPSGGLDDLSDLVEFGLVRLRPTRVELRYEVLRPVAAHMNSLPGTRNIKFENEIRAAQLDWLLVRTKEWAAALDGPEGALALGRFDDEHTDVVELLHWSVGAGRYADAALLASTTAGLFIASGRAHESSSLLTTLLPAFGAPHPAPPGSFLVALARVRYHSNASAEARDLCQAALETGGMAVEDEALAHTYLGAGLVGAGDPDGAAAHAQTALDLAERHGLYLARAVGLSVLAICAAMRGDFDRERELHERRLEVVRAHGDISRVGDTLNTLAEIALDTPDLDAARAYSDEALVIAGGHRPIERRDALITGARVSALAGQFDRGATELAEAVDLAERLSNPLGVAQCARATASLMHATGRPGQAIRLFGAAEAVAASPGGAGEPMEADLREALHASRALEGVDAAERAWTFGSATATLAQLASLVRESLTGH